MFNLIIVEDSEVYIKVLEKLFNDRTKYNVIAHRSLREAKITLRENRVDVVLLDMNLPDGNGKELIHYIREELSQKEVFIYAITSEVSEESVLEMYDIGADHYFSKPFNPILLRGSVKRVFKRLEDCEFYPE